MRAVTLLREVDLHLVGVPGGGAARRVRINVLEGIAICVGGLDPQRYGPLSICKPICHILKHCNVQLVLSQARQQVGGNNVWALSVL